MKIILTFIGATTEVTGSMTLLETSSGKVLIDCGLHQGVEKIVKLNLTQLPFSAKEIKAVLLTHAHLDHCGMIPRLIKLGFRGAIYCTHPTMKLARLIMSDSARILENNPNHPLRNFYSIEEVTIASSLFKCIDFNQKIELCGFSFHFQPAGHILGASSIVIDGDQTIVFSGDLGRNDDPLMPPPPKSPNAQALVLESTYGGRERSGNIKEEILNFIKNVKLKNKIGIIASFAVARSQLLITLIIQIFKEHPELKIRFVIDGPMMTEANKIYKEFSDLTLQETQLYDALDEVEVIDHEREWLSLSKRKGPLVVLSSSGMISGGRIWRYLENWQDDANAILFLPGYQAEGTAGRALSEGIKTVRDEVGKSIHWQGEVLTSSAFSSHADQSELIEWISKIDKKAQIILNHGEESSKKALENKLAELGFKNIFIAKLNQRYEF